MIVRWGVYSPFTNTVNPLDGRVEVNMCGSGIEGNNPENKLVFKRPDTIMQDEQSSKAAPGKITFDIRKGNTVSLYLQN